MSDTDIKKYSNEELRPLLSLNPKKEIKDEKQAKEEQDALWSRSLEFFENMKKNAQHA